jgi:hypothetical protein
MLLLFGTMVPARGLIAQTPGGEGVGDGFWWSVSAYAGGARLTCDLCDLGRDLGPALGVAIGAYASPAARVGIEAGGWTHQEGDVRETAYTGALVAEVHPRPRSGLHLIGGLGWIGYRAEAFHYDAVSLRLGLGWDLPLSASWVVGNRLTLDAASFGTLSADDTPVARAVGLSVVRFGVYLRQR